MGAFQMLPVDSPDRALVGGSGGGWWWQSSQDTLDKADRDILFSHANLYLTIIWRICTAEQLPYEFITAVKDCQQLLGELSKTAGSHLDLGPAIRAANAFHEAANKVEEIRGKLSATDVKFFNAGLMAVSRAINPVLYTIVGEYDQDLALQLPMFPGLKEIRKLSSISPDSNEYRFLKTRLIRERNRAEEALIRGAIELRRAVQNMK
jgi:N-acetylated-alpha-linked acidic dipeptidase